MSKQIDTVSRWLKKSSIKKAVKQEYDELILSELILALMEDDPISVRKLAAEIGISKSVVQDLRSGKRNDMKLSNFIKLTSQFGYHLVLERGDRRVQVS